MLRWSTKNPDFPTKFYRYYPGQTQSKKSCRFLGGYLTFLVEPYRVQPKKVSKSIVLIKPEGQGWHEVCVLQMDENWCTNESEYLPAFSNLNIWGIRCVYASNIEIWKRWQVLPGEHSWSSLRWPRAYLSFVYGKRWRKEKCGDNGWDEKKKTKNVCQEEGCQSLLVSFNLLTFFIWGKCRAPYRRPAGYAFTFVYKLLVGIM